MCADVGTKSTSPGPSRWRLPLKVGVSLALLGWVLHAVVTREGVDAAWARLAEIDGGWLLLGALGQIAAVGIGVARWRVLLDAQGMPLPLSWLGRSYLVGRFVGAFTPSTAGLDVYRAVDVARWTGRRADAASVILVEKLVGLLALCLVTFALLPLGVSERLGSSATLFAAALGAGSLVGLVVLRRPRLATPLLRFVPGFARPRLAKLLHALGARGLDAGVLARTLLLGVASHLATAGVFLAAGLALGLDVGAADLLLTGVAIVIATLLPVSVGGVGVREGVAVVLLAPLGVGAIDATLVAVLGYLVTQPPALLGGLLTLAPRRAPLVVGGDAAATV